MLDVMILGNEVLRRKAAPVADIGAEIKDFTGQMFEVMAAGKGIGLAAPQVGRSERFFVVHVDRDKPRVFINPEITAMAEDLVPYEEGCLSIPGLYADVKRPSAIKIQAYNEKGRPFSLDAEGLLARVVQHELDHLNGILFIDKLSEAKRVRLISQWEKRLRA